MKIEEIIEKVKKELYTNTVCTDVFFKNILCDLKSALKEQNELIEENKRLKDKLLAAQVFDYDDLSDQAKKDFMIKDGK